MTNESWRDIPGYEGLYQVSSFGFVMSRERTGTKGGVLKPDLNRSGYQQVRLYKGNKSQVFYVHRLVMLAFNGDSTKQTNHINGQKADNRLSNLEYVTPSENAIHAIGLFGKWMGKGEESSQAKLSQAEVNQIKDMRGQYSQRELARRFGISEAQVSRIINGIRWNK